MTPVITLLPVNLPTIVIPIPLPTLGLNDEVVVARMSGLTSQKAL
jgi:hypothetical protein